MGLNRVRMGRNRLPRLEVMAHNKLRNRRVDRKSARDKQREGLSKDRREGPSKDRREVKQALSPSRSVCQAWKGWRFRLEVLFL